MIGGCYFLEVTRNVKIGSWHTHLHVIWEGSFISQQKLREQWLAITGDSFIVDVRFIRDTAGAISYLAKYLGKPAPASVADDDATLLDYVMGMRGRRLLGVFGDWRTYNLLKLPDSRGSWLVVAPLQSILRAAAAGDVSCSRILELLNGYAKAHTAYIHGSDP